MKNKVLLVDDHPVIRMAVRILLEQTGYEVLAEASNGVEAVQLARTHHPDVIILDIGIPDLDGFEVIERIKALKLESKILVLTSQPVAAFSLRCMQAGAAGFVSKQEDLNGLVNAIQAVISGYNYFPSLPTGGTPGESSEAELLKTLSNREIMVLQQLAQGRTNKEIADVMLLSNKTISTYKVRLMQKLHVNSLVALVELAKRNGLA